MQNCWPEFLTVLGALYLAWVAVFFTLPRVRRGFNRFGHWLDRLMGGVLQLSSISP